jgi:hypothetical protein
MPKGILFVVFISNCMCFSIDQPTTYGDNTSRKSFDSCEKTEMERFEQPGQKSVQLQRRGLMKTMKTGYNRDTHGRKSNGLHHTRRTGSLLLEYREDGVQRIRK